MIFLSHSWTQKPVAYRLVEALASEGLPVWLDDEQLVSGVLIRPGLHEAIANAKVFLYLVSPEANKSRWVQDELAFALAQEGERMLEVIPVRMDETDPPSVLRGRLYQTIDQGLGGATKLASDLARKPDARALPASYRLTTTVRLTDRDLRHHLDQVRRLRTQQEVSVLLLGRGHERLDSRYWQLSEIEFPVVEGARAEIEQISEIIQGIHAQSRRIIRAADDAAQQYIHPSDDDPHFEYRSAALVESMHALLYRLSWNCEYLESIRDGKSIDESIKARRTLAEPYDAHICDFSCGPEPLGKLRVPAHGHPYSGDLPEGMSWGMTSPFGDLFPTEVGKIVGYLLASQVFVGTRDRVTLPDPGQLLYGLG